jgi:RecB family endonuclease NucS
MLEVHLENLLAEQPDLIEPGLKLVTRQETLRGKRIDLMFRDAQGATLVVEVKRSRQSR